MSISISSMVTRIIPCVGARSLRVNALPIGGFDNHPPKRPSDPVKYLSECIDDVEACERAFAAIPETNRRARANAYFDLVVAEIRWRDARNECVESLTAEPKKRAG